MCDISIHATRNEKEKWTNFFSDLPSTVESSCCCCLMLMLAGFSDFNGKLSSMMQKIWSRGQFSDHVDWNIRYASSIPPFSFCLIALCAIVWNWNASTKVQIADESMAQSETQKKRRSVCVIKQKATNPNADPFVRILFRCQQKTLIIKILFQICNGFSNASPSSCQSDLSPFWTESYVAVICLTEKSIKSETIK